MANSAIPSTIVTALGAPTAAAPQARAATAAVTATSAWLTRIVHLPQVVYDDVPGVVDARHAGNVIELGQAGQRQRGGCTAPSFGRRKYEPEAGSDSLSRRSTRI